MDRLRLGFERLIEAEAKARGWDPRDTMISLTPFIDCARRLGVDPRDALGSIAASGPGWFRETFDAFVGRADVTLEAFGWSLDEGPNGPAYRFGWPEQRAADGRAPSVRRAGPR